MDNQALTSVGKKPSFSFEKNCVFKHAVEKGENFPHTYFYFILNPMKRNSEDDKGHLIHGIGHFFLTSTYSKEKSLERRYARKGMVSAIL